MTENSDKASGVGAVNTASHGLIGLPDTEEQRKYHELTKKLEQLQKDVGEIRTSYLRRPWTTIDLISRENFSLHQKITENAERILEFRLEDFYKQNHPDGEANVKNFHSDHPAISNIIYLAQFLKKEPQSSFVKAPKNVLLQIVESSSLLADCLRIMRDIAAGRLDPNDQQKIKEITEKKNLQLEIFYAAYRDFYDAVTPLKNAEYSSEFQAIKEQVQRLTDKGTTEGIREHNILFKKQANRHFEAAALWLTTGFAGVLVASVYAIHSMGIFEDLALHKGAVSSEIIISLVSIRLFIFGLLSSVIFWSFKNYRLNKHNELLNRQKEMALSTFTEFSNASGTDIEMRKIVLNKVTSTIFDAQHLGYIGADSKDSPDNANMLHLLENLVIKKT